jgi:hypothetical protein
MIEKASMLLQTSESIKGLLEQQLTITISTTTPYPPPNLRYIRSTTLSGIGMVIFPRTPLRRGG